MSVSRFWSGVVDVKTYVAQTHLPLEPRVCLLHLVNDLAPAVVERTFLGLSFFYTWKSIAMHWKKPTSPSLAFWKCLINANLPLYWDTYDHRGRKNTFYKVWSRWMEELSMVDDSSSWFSSHLISPYACSIYFNVTLTGSSEILIGCCGLVSEPSCYRLFLVIFLFFLWYYLWTPPHKLGHWSLYTSFFLYVKI